MVKLTASSPKLSPKNKNAAAEAIAYDQVATFESALWAGSSAGDNEGRPITKNAMPKNSHGADKMYTDGFNLKREYHTADEMRNTAPSTYN